jgi:hypothetical protein
MALSTLAELKDAIVRWAKRDNLSASLDDIILTGEQHILRNLRVREMEEALSVSISGTAAVPSDFLGLKHARITGSTDQPLIVKTPDAIYAAYPTRSATSKPVSVAVDGSSFVFGPYPDATYTMVGTYYAKPTSVLSDATLLAAYPDVFLWASLAELEPFMKNDKRVALWMGKRDQAIASANSVSRAANWSGPMTMSVF